MLQTKRELASKHGNEIKTKDEEEMEEFTQFLSSLDYDLLKKITEAVKQ